MKPLKRKFLAALTAVASAMGVCSCSLINDDSDCVDSYNVFEFTYDHNLKFADAFAAEVKSVTLMGFDSESGTLVYASRTPREQLEGAKKNSLTVRLEPGRYDFLVWAGDYDDHFLIADAKIGKSKLTDFTCRLKTEQSHPDSPDAPETHGHSAQRLEHLFHALVSLDLTYASPSAPLRHQINLTKDTNSIRIMLQQQNAESPLSKDDFIFEVTDRNAHLNHDNSQASDPALGNVIYHPWATSEGSTDYKPTDRSGDDSGNIDVTMTNVDVLLAEMTVGRLFADTEPMLTVKRRSDGETLFSIPLLKYALMMRGKYWADMEPQEFLDRQDEFSLTFILDKNQKWISVAINILGWHEVYVKTEAQ